MAMSQRGFVRHLLGGPAEGPEHVYRPPRGVYWMAEPTRAEELLAAAKAAAVEIGEPTARILTVEGAAAWYGLPPIDGE